MIPSALAKPRTNNSPPQESKSLTTNGTSLILLLCLGEYNPWEIWLFNDHHSLPLVLTDLIYPGPQSSNFMIPAGYRGETEK